MFPPPLTKYAFRIRTRDGLVVDHLMIHGRDMSDAERKLKQIYRESEILECVCHRGTVRTPATAYVRAPTTFEEVVNLITT